MDEHISSISDAYEKYIDEANAVLDAYHFAGGLQTEATNQALEKLTEQRQHLVSACDNAEGSVHRMIKQVREFEAIEPVMKNLCQIHKLLGLFSLSCKTLTSCFNLMIHQVRVLEAATCTNAAELAPVSPANAERRQPNARDAARSRARVIWERNMAMPPVLSSIDLNSAAQNPAQLNCTRVLSELDPKKTN